MHFLTLGKFPSKIFLKLWPTTLTRILVPHLCLHFKGLVGFFLLWSLIFKGFVWHFSFLVCSFLVLWNYVSCLFALHTLLYLQTLIISPLLDSFSHFFEFCCWVIGFFKDTFFSANVLFNVSISQLNSLLKSWIVFFISVNLMVVFSWASLKGLVSLCSFSVIWLSCLFLSFFFKKIPHVF